MHSDFCVLLIHLLLIEMNVLDNMHQHTNKWGGGGGGEGGGTDVDDRFMDVNIMFWCR